MAIAVLQPSHSTRGRFYAELCPVDAFDAVCGDGPAAPADAAPSGLCADELKLLRVLYFCGAQAALDIRGGTEPAPSVMIIGREAGCLDLSSVPAYLARLRRQGLIHFSWLPLAARRYEGLERDALLAKAGVTRRQARRCAIRLTSLGSQAARDAFADLDRSAAAVA